MTNMVLMEGDYPAISTALMEDHLVQMGLVPMEEERLAASTDQMEDSWV